jgi:hypothetical protein
MGRLLRGARDHFCAADRITGLVAANGYTKPLVEQTQKYLITAHDIRNDSGITTTTVLYLHLISSDQLRKNDSTMESIHYVRHH